MVNKDYQKAIFRGWPQCLTLLVVRYENHLQGRKSSRGFRVKASCIWSLKTVPHKRGHLLQIMLQ